MPDINVLFKCGVAAGLMCFSHSILAGCTVRHPVTQTAGGIPTTLAVTGSQEPGAKIGAEISVPKSTRASGFSCSAGTTYALLRLNPGWTPTHIADVYQTSIPGIGVKIREQDYGNPLTLNRDVQNWYTAGYAGSAIILGIKVQFYVTGPVTPGVYPAETMVEAWANTAVSTVNGANYITLKLPAITVKAQTCETSDISVNLDKHYSADFGNLYSTSAAKPFNFEIKNCSAGMPAVSYTFKPAPGVTLKEAGTARQHLTLNSSSTASGVGVQVLDGNDVPLPFNQKINYPGYQKAIGGSYVIPMKARYIKTGAISGGTASSALEFTMAYE